MSGYQPSTCRSLDEAYRITQSIVANNDKPSEQVGLAIRLLRVPQEFHRSMSERWQRAGKPTLSRFAPYTAFVVSVEVFFQIALAAELISTRWNSNRTDIAYLF